MYKLLKVLITSILISNLVNCVPSTWTEETVKEFMKGCNPDNDSKIQEYCECFLNEVKTKYPNPSDYVKLSLDKEVITPIANKCKKAQNK